MYGYFCLARIIFDFRRVHRSDDRKTSECVFYDATVLCAIGKAGFALAQRAASDRAPDPKFSALDLEVLVARSSPNCSFPQVV